MGFSLEPVGGKRQIRRSHCDPYEQPFSGLWNRVGEGGKEGGRHRFCRETQVGSKLTKGHNSDTIVALWATDPCTSQDPSNLPFLSPHSQHSCVG